jgi:mannose-6-phosphate isomerase-like protein (cupin superfamily)
LPKLIESPTRVQAAGNLPKIIDEYIGRLNTQEGRISVAHMRSPAGWEEPGQTPEFEEYTIVLRGRLKIRHKQGELEVRAGQAVITHPGEWIQYSTPDEPAEYIAICLPGLSAEKVLRIPKVFWFISVNQSDQRHQWQSWFCLFTQYRASGLRAAKVLRIPRYLVYQR